MGKHKRVFQYWFEEHALPLEKLLSPDEQIHACEMWLRHEENWKLTQKEMEKWDAFGNPPAEPEALE